MKLSTIDISLRDLELNDLPQIEHWLHPDHIWHNFNAPYYPKTPVEKIPDRIAIFEKHINANQWGTPRMRLAIANGDDKIIGTVTRYWISEASDWAAIGIAIWNPDEWGKGYGYQALGLWCDYLFDVEPKFIRLDARTWSGNAGMMRLAEKLGFTKEAVFRKARMVNDTYYDGIGYGILREEWQDIYPNGFGHDK